jgi:hypothetical protein
MAATTPKIIDTCVNRAIYSVSVIGLALPTISRAATWMTMSTIVPVNRRRK